MSLEVLSTKAVAQKLDANNFVAEILERVRGLEITDEDSFSAVTYAYRESRKIRKQLEEEKKLWLAPYKLVIDHANDVAKKLTAKLDEAEEIANRKTSAYLKQMEQKKLEEQRLRQEEVVKSGESNLEIYEPVDSTLRGEGAMVYTVKEKKFRVIDVNSIPRQYLMVNEALIKQNIKLGVNEIPGVEIYEEEVTKMRAR